MTDPLLTPFRLKHLTLRNRIVITSHEPAYTQDGMPKERYRAYHAERARAGVALTMTAGSASVSRDSPPAFGNILAWQDEVVPWMRALADECHDLGAAVMIQLTHLGRRTRWDTGDWLPVIGAGPAREPAHRAFPKRAEDWDITRIINDYTDAAERMQAAGLDGIEIEAYGHLVDQFWSPVTNDMAAPWGGTGENRLRFAESVLGAIRERVGPDFILSLRMAIDERISGGIAEADGIAIANHLRDLGLVDLLNVIRGHIDTDAALTDVIPIQGMASAPHLDFAGRVRAATGLPVLHAARIPDVATARHAIAADKLDLVGMTRAHLADPHLVSKLTNGAEDRIRPCVGANYCLDRIYQGGAALCIHNPSTGREQTLPHTIPAATTPRRVTIVGAGPAGLEAARVAALRGHTVTVFEAAPDPGGQVRLIAQLPRRREMQSVIGWRMTKCERLGVTFHFNRLAEAGDVLATHPDVVLIATGGLPRTDFGGAGETLAVSAWDIIAGDVRPGHRVLICDDAGDHAGLMAAEIAAAAGATVEIATPDRSFAPEVMGMNLVPYIRNLQGQGATFLVTWRLANIVRDGNALIATLASDYGPATLARQVDQVVVNHGTTPLDDLYFDLKPGSRNLSAVDHGALVMGQPQPPGTNADGAFLLYRLGDAVAARNIHAAILDALRLVRVL